MPSLMVQGTSSSAGKSLLATAFARVLARRGHDVVPFKAQNMSNNARVIAGGEIGVAQYLQALAARVEPEVRMNPILVKPEADNRSQVIVLGQVDHELSALPWRARRTAFWPVARDALTGLIGEHDSVVLEGAGSPAEINLRDTDLANMRSAELAGAKVVIVVDIDRGGAFAHLYGTWALLRKDERRRVCGFVLNKFRGDASLLAPAPETLESLTGVPVLGVLPALEHGLPDEDGIGLRPGRTAGPRVAIVRYPTASNLDEFRALEEVADLRWVARAEEVAGADLLVLPGSKQVASDLAWLRSSGVAGAVDNRVRRGLPVLGICGGLQMLGREIVGVAGVDGSSEGLGHLALRTSFGRDKLVRVVEARFGELAPPWSSLSGLNFAGYEIRHGSTEAVEPELEALTPGLGYVRGSVLGISVHGLFEEGDAMEALLGVRVTSTRNAVFEHLADAVEEHLDMPRIMRMAGLS